MSCTVYNFKSLSFIIKKCINKERIYDVVVVYGVPVPLNHYYSYQLVYMKTIRLSVLCLLGSMGVSHSYWPAFCDWHWLLSSKTYISKARTRFLITSIKYPVSRVCMYVFVKFTLQFNKSNEDITRNRNSLTCVWGVYQSELVIHTYLSRKFVVQIL